MINQNRDPELFECCEDADDSIGDFDLPEYDPEQFELDEDFEYKEEDDE